SLSLMLLIGAALLTVSFVRLQHVEPGFDPSQVLTADVSLPVPGAFDVAKDGPGWARFFHELQARLAQSQGIDAAGAVSVLPLGDTAEALTHQIRTFFDFSSGRLVRTVVGVVGDVKNGALDAPPQPQVYVPEQQMTYPGLQVVLRTKGDPTAALAILKRETRAIDPTLAVSRPRPMRTVFDDSLARQ